MIDLCAVQALREQRCRIGILQLAQRLRIKRVPRPETPEERRLRERFGVAWHLLAQANITPGSCVLVVNQDGVLADAIWQRYEKPRIGAEFMRPCEDQRLRGSYDSVLVNGGSAEELCKWLSWVRRGAGWPVPDDTMPLGLSAGKSLVAGGRVVMKALRRNVTPDLLRTVRYAGAGVVAQERDALVIKARREPLRLEVA